MKRVLVLVALAGCGAAAKPMDDRETARELRVARLEIDLADARWEREALERRIAALEARDGSEVAALASRVAALEAAKAAPPPEPAKGEPPRGPKVTIVDGGPAAKGAVPRAGEAVRVFAVIDGDTFSFVRPGGDPDLAGLAGVEAPEREADGPGWARAKERLQELLGSGEVSFAFDASHENPRENVGHGRLLVYVWIRKGEERVCANDVLVGEGLARTRGIHERRAELEKLEADAKAAGRGIWGRK